MIDNLSLAVHDYLEVRHEWFSKCYVMVMVERFSLFFFIMSLKRFKIETQTFKTVTDKRERGGGERKRQKDRLRRGREGLEMENQYKEEKKKTELFLNTRAIRV